MSDEIAIGNYLLRRLRQLGVSTLFGVPGDFNLGFLDFVEDDQDIAWVGNCNELNAAYAADGYARVAPGRVGALLTTFGVGELSALNGIAGSYAEMIPIVHIVGIPQRAYQVAKPILHHTLADGRFDVYTQAHKLFTASQAVLMDETTATSEIDRVLVDCVTLRRPIYLAIPTDLVSAKVSAEPLSRRLESIKHDNIASDEDGVVDEIHKAIESTQGTVIILVDACSNRKECTEETLDFVKKTGFPVYCCAMGKTVVDESYERYGGLYIGAFSRPTIRQAVESAGLILWIGSLKTDFNTGLFTSKLPDRVIEFHSTRTHVLDREFPFVGMKSLLPKLAARLKMYRPASPDNVPYKSPVPVGETEQITQKWIWPRMSHFFRSGDIIVTETGTSSFGTLDILFPDDCIFVSQILFGSIGYTVGATLGSAVAAKEEGARRTILFIGDGSLQLGVQELSTMIMTGVRPIIFLLNNAGYTIERCVQAPERKYHDIMNWTWTSLLKDLGDPEEKMSKSYTVRTKTELSKLLDDSVFAEAGKIQLVEIILDKFDAPDLLVSIAGTVGRNATM